MAIENHGADPLCVANVFQRAGVEQQEIGRFSRCNAAILIC
jgi:hypothetical protein